MIVVFQLMPHGQDGYGCVIVNFKQRYVSGCTEWNHQFTQKWISLHRFSITERRKRKALDCISYCLECPFR